MIPNATISQNSSSAILALLATQEFIAELATEIQQTIEDFISSLEEEGRKKMSESPLTEANPVISMQEIMSRDPEELSRQDRDAIVRTLRAQRFQFMQDEAQAKPKKMG